MKKWNSPELQELNINKTEKNWFGDNKDGGYLGDGHISGHLQWGESNEEVKPDDPKPGNETEIFS